LQNKIIFAAFDENQMTNDDRLLQWEVSYKTYKEYYEKFTFDYVVDKIKIDEEGVALFQFKLSFLTLAYTKQEKKTLSYFDFKKTSQLVSSNLLAHSLHLLGNKFGKIGCGIMHLHSSKLTATSSLNCGNTSQRLPCGMFTTYKQHREKTEAIWKLPTDTLNGVASDSSHSTFKKFKDTTTQLLWIIGCNNNELEPYNHYLKDTENGFIVYSTSYYDDFVLEADLILPTASFFEKNIGFENSQRELTLSKQQVVPYGESMSELWQILEFSKRFTLRDFWGNIKIKDNLGLKNVLNDLQNFGYSPKTSLFTALFHNNKTKKYKLTSEDFFNPLSLNSEVKGDNRTTFGSDGKLFEGYKFFIQKYLFEELRLFGSGNGYDFGSFFNYSSDFYEKWPIIFSNETKYRFNSSYDSYAKRLSKEDDEFIFYGKLGGKQLPFGDATKITSNNLKELKYRAKIFMEREK
jgi:nitrate reductase NapA